MSPIGWNDQHEIVDLGYETPCWRFTGYVMPNGYGRKWSTLKKKGTTAIRAYWHHYRGEVGPDDSLILDHLCRNPVCVNPDHLEPVDYSENARRGYAGIPSGILQQSKTHCPAGHEYNEENTRVRTKPGRRPFRECRICIRERRLVSR